MNRLLRLLRLVCNDLKKILLPLIKSKVVHVCTCTCLKKSIYRYCFSLNMYNFKSNMYMFAAFDAFDTNGGGVHG